MQEDSLWYANKLGRDKCSYSDLVEYFADNQDERIGINIDDYQVTYSESDSYVHEQMPAKGEHLSMEAIIAGEQALHHRGIFAYEASPQSPQPPSPRQSPPPSPMCVVKLATPPTSPMYVVKLATPPPASPTQAQTSLDPEALLSPQSPLPPPLDHDRITPTRTSSRLNGRQRLDFKAMASGTIM
jgi:hypothetical protein